MPNRDDSASASTTGRPSETRELPLTSTAAPSAKLSKLRQIVTTFVRHFTRMADLSVAEQDRVIADWVRLLQPKPVKAVEEARDRWLINNAKMPTMAEFHALIAIVENEGKPLPSKASGADMGPAPAFLSPARPGVPFANLTGPEKWSWYARMHAFREDYPELGGPPPFDPAHRFDDIELTRQAKEERRYA